MSRRELIFDIETMPALVYTWGLRPDFIGLEQVKEHPRVGCWSAGWLDSKRVEFMSEYHDNPRDMLVGLRDLLDEADVVTGYNSNRFDVKHMNREFIEHGLTPPSPYVSVDLYQVVTKNFMFLSHKLANITERLHLSGKLSHEGFRMWRACLGDYGAAEREKAWNMMRRYSKQDTATTRELRVELTPYIKNLPAGELYKTDREDGRLACPACESVERVQRRGFKTTKTRKYPRFHCTECGSWFAETRSVESVGVTL